MLLDEPKDVGRHPVGLFPVYIVARAITVENKKMRKKQTRFSFETSALTAIDLSPIRHAGFSATFFGNSNITSLLCLQVFRFCRS